jgi:hypothetical protein
MGVLAVGEWLQRVPFRAAVAARPALALAIPLAIGTAVATGTAVQSVPANAYTVSLQFNDHRLVGPAKLQFFKTVARLVPPSDLVADNPFDGTSFLYVLDGTRVLFPQLNPSSNNADTSYLAANLAQLGKNSRVCDLVRQYDVHYMVIAPDYFWLGSGNPGSYAGVADPEGRSGFQLMASADDGKLRLYKITSCKPANQVDPVEAASRGSG